MVDMSKVTHLTERPGENATPGIRVSLLLTVQVEGIH